MTYWETYLNYTDINEKKPFNQLQNKWNEDYIVYTKDPNREAWNTLLNFTSSAYLDKFLKK